MMHPWRENGKSLALMEETQDKRDPEAKAIACYGVYLRAHSQMLVRCVEQRPRSKITGEFLAWIAQQVSQMGQRVRPLIGDNVSWHLSKPVRPWVRQHQAQVKRTGNRGAIDSLSVTCKKSLLECD
ncbi:hypothetical protein [Leptothermofonsia sp. ETS-13]|uniref:hypothetical protein n=1 Tax=Leptothermofonsia sp. ETS-13 TaxID=3035696 RepID=UPI003BA12249